MQVWYANINILVNNCSIFIDVIHVFDRSSCPLCFDFTNLAPTEYHYSAFNSWRDWMQPALQVMDNYALVNINPCRPGTCSGEYDSFALPMTRFTNKKTKCCKSPANALLVHLIQIATWNVERTFLFMSPTYISQWQLQRSQYRLLDMPSLGHLLTWWFYCMLTT